MPRKAKSKLGALGEIIYPIMTKRKMSLQALASAVGVQRHTCYAWLHEFQRPSLEMLRRMSLVLEISFGTLVAAIYSDVEGAELESLVEIYLHLPEEKRSTLLFFAQALESQSRQSDIVIEKPEPPATL